MSEETIRQLEYQCEQFRAIQAKCFDENDQLRQRVMELEINYSNAQDELEKRDMALKEMSEQITVLQQTIVYMQPSSSFRKQIQKPKQKKSKKKTKDVNSKIKVTQDKTKD